MVNSRMLDFGLDYRGTRPTSGKIIFISCEGNVTEEEYFALFSSIYPDIKEKIKFVSVKEDILSIPVEERTEEQKKELRKSSPNQLLKKINEFKSNPEKIQKYDFAHHPDDEFWLVADVDDHTKGGKLKGWDDTLQECREKNYKYAVSNPFFELWLLLHHDDIKADDAKLAVTDTHDYEKTDHFSDRLTALGVPLLAEEDGYKKHINSADYNKENIKMAISRAEKLDAPPCDYPTDIGSTVYRLVKIIDDLDKQYKQ